MRITLLTIHTPPYNTLAELTDAGKAEYAARHAYDFNSIRINTCPPEHIAWKNVRAMLGMLESGDCDWVFYSGADVLLTNHTQRLESITKPEADGILACDALMLNNDVMLFQNTDGAKRFLRKVIDMFPQYAGHQWMTQAAMWDLVNPNKKEDWPGVVYVPQRTFNAYDYNHYRYLGGNYAEGKDAMGNDGQWQKGDFAIHFPGMSQPSKVDEVRKHLDQVVK